MELRNYSWPIWLLTILSGCGADSTPMNEYDPPGRGPYAVGSTNMAVAAEYADMGDERMHAYLLGVADDAGNGRYVADVLAHPESAWIVDISVPDDDALYGPAGGKTLPVVAFVAYPSAAEPPASRYAFPYHDAAYGEFEAMLGPGETPDIAGAGTRFPLIVLAHGAWAHGIYDVGHAHRLASHGYIVAVVFFGDNRYLVRGGPNDHVGFLRPLVTRTVIDSLLESESFGPRIDRDNIGISGHSFGGFTALAASGGPFRGEPATVNDPRVTAAVLAAPWVGGNDDGTDDFAFGDGNEGLVNVDIPVLCAFGSSDEDTPASFILPAMKQLSGPTYVVELVDQPHVFDGGSWQDRDNWELLFFDAYLKDGASRAEDDRLDARRQRGSPAVRVPADRRTITLRRTSGPRRYRPPMSSRSGATQSGGASRRSRRFSSSVNPESLPFISIVRSAMSQRPSRRTRRSRYWP